MTPPARCNDTGTSVRAAVITLHFTALGAASRHNAIGALIHEKLKGIIIAILISKSSDLDAIGIFDISSIHCGNRILYY